MHIGGLSTKVISLAMDAHQAEVLLQSKDTPFARRTFIRTSFAFIEGVIWSIKTFLVEVSSLQNGLYSPEEVNFLREVSYEVLSNGLIKEKGRAFIKIEHNLPFTIRMIDKLLTDKRFDQIDNKLFSQFNKAVAVRNALAHPKGDSMIRVTDDELTLCREVVHWFNTLIQSVLSDLDSAPNIST